mgnify:FL=1
MAVKKVLYQLTAKTFFLLSRNGFIPIMISLYVNLYPTDVMRSLS